MSAHTTGRQAFSLIEALVALAIMAIMTSAITEQVLANRRQVEHRQRQQQSLWLARAGAELAADRLLGDPAGYRGETVRPLPESEVKIVVQPEPGEANVYRVISAARYPAEGKDTVARSVTRRFRRVPDGDRMRLEPE